MKYIILGLFLLLGNSAFSSEVHVEHKPISIGALQEIGILHSGVSGTNPLQELKGEWVDHFGAFINKEIVINHRLHLYAGLGGIFQFRKPEEVGITTDGEQKKAFFIGPTRTEAVYHIGDLEAPILKLGVGQFGYKYNSDAANLGEYLFRTGIYPNYIMTGGYAIVNNAVGYLQGFKAQFHYGNFKADLLLTTETAMPPFYDYSPALVMEYTLGEGLLTLGGGIQLERLLSVDSKKAKRRINENGYLYWNGTAYSADLNYYSSRIGFYTQKGITDSVDHYNTLLDSISSLIDGGAKIHHFSSDGIKLMGRASFDVKKLFSEEFANLFSPGDLRVFGEVAVLGTENKPVFYTDIQERMPMMVGINLPTFKYLDLISVQAEYYKSPYLNNTLSIGSIGANTPYIPSGEDPIVSKDSYSDLTSQDDWKWSVLVKKKVLSHIQLSFQAARDHYRPLNANVYYGPQFAPNTFTVRKKDWYWIGQISWGI